MKKTVIKMGLIVLVSSLLGGCSLFDSGPKRCKPCRSSMDIKLLEYQLATRT